MKRPSFQFYPADWRNDAALRMCSLGARGLWWEMICIMHGADPYGHLVAACQPITPEELARIVGESKADVTKWLSELERRKVYSVNDDGAIYSRRMIRDEVERDQWRKRQARHRDVTPDVTPPVTPESQPSSSSPSSSKEKNGSRFALTQLPDEWKSFCKTERQDLDPERVFTDFHDYWIGIPGKQGRKTDWLATWRNWVRRQNQGKAKPQYTGGLAL